MTDYRAHVGRSDLRELAELAIDLPTRTRRLYERRLHSESKSARTSDGARQSKQGDPHLEPAEMQVLIALFLEDWQTVRELGERLALYPQSVSKGVRRLQTLNLVREKIDKEDTRKRRQLLSAKGRRRVEAFLRGISEPNGDSDPPSTRRPRMKRDGLEAKARLETKARLKEE